MSDHLDRIKRTLQQEMRRAETYGGLDLPTSDVDQAQTRLAVKLRAAKHAADVWRPERQRQGEEIARRIAKGRAAQHEAAARRDEASFRRRMAQGWADARAVVRRGLTSLERQAADQHARRTERREAQRREAERRDRAREARRQEVMRYVAGQRARRAERDRRWAEQQARWVRSLAEAKTRELEPWESPDLGETAELRTRKMP